MKKLLYSITLILLTQITFGQIKTIKVRGAGGKTDTTLISKIVHDSLSTFSRGTDSTIINTVYPLQAVDSQYIVGADTLHKNKIQFRSDSLVTKLDYAAPATDTTTYTNTTLIPKGYLNARLNSLPTGTGTVTSVGTGYGLSGGIITTTGTIVVDSAALSLKYLRIKDSSIAYVTPYQSSLKQNLVTVTTTGSSGAATFNQSTGALNIPNYAGGGASLTTVDSTNIAVTTQTVFTFPYTLTSYTQKQVIRNGVFINPADYSISGSNVTFTGFTCDAGDKIRFIGFK